MVATWKDGAPVIAEHKPVNNECPVCETMAKPLSFCVTHGNDLSHCHADDLIAYGDSFPPQITRCVYCNCAFHQTPEHHA